MADQKEAEKPFHANPVLLAPVVASLIIGFLFAYLIWVSQSASSLAFQLPESGFDPIGIALIFVVLTGFGASMIYLFVKRKMKNLIRLLVGFAITVVTFFLSYVYSLILFSLMNVGDVGFLAFVVGILATAIVDVELFLFYNILAEMVILALGGALGTFLGVAISSTITTVLILLFLAVYDVVAVFRGPVGKIATEDPDYLRGLSFSFKDIQMGLGDLTFYSMLAAHALIFFGLWSSISGMAGVLIGSFLSFKMLEKKGMFPGLPFSIILGLLGVFAVVVL
jgi:hypothetical protein